MALEPLNCGLSHLDTLQTLADDLPFFNFISHAICVLYFQQNELFMHSGCARSGDSIALIHHMGQPKW